VAIRRHHAAGNGWVVSGCALMVDYVYDLCFRLLRLRRRVVISPPAWGPINSPPSSPRWSFLMILNLRGVEKNRSPSSPHLHGVRLSHSLRLSTPSPAISISSSGFQGASRIFMARSLPGVRAVAFILLRAYSMAVEPTPG